MALPDHLGTEAQYVTGDDVVVATTLGELDADRRVTAGPVRVVRSHRGQRHYCGWFRSVTIGGHLVYESRLELDRLWLADFGTERPVALEQRQSDREHRPQ